MLYRQLSTAAERERMVIAGPLLLLQLWSWSRLPLGCPENIVHKSRGIEQQKEEIDTNSRPVFGAKWCAAHEFLVPHNAGTEYYRNQIDLIREGMVNWEPYNDTMVNMPVQVHNDRAWWFARIPLIHFWVVEFHYLDRVMRQFGLRQAIPPQLPQDEDLVCKLHKIKHRGGIVRDWKIIHDKYIQKYSDVEATMVHEERPFDLASLIEYRSWFQQCGMYTVFLDSQCLGGLQNPIPYPRDNIEWTGYMPSGLPLARIGIREIKNAAWGIKCVVTSGCKKIGKHVLRKCLGNLRDLNLEPRLHNMLHEAGLPTQIEDIPSDDDDSATVHTPSPPRDTSLAVLDDWIYSGKGFSTYLGTVVTNVTGVPTSQDTGQVTQELMAPAQQSTPSSQDQTLPSLKSIQVVDYTGTSFSRLATSCYAQEGTHEK